MYGYYGIQWEALPRATKHVPLLAHATTTANCLHVATVSSFSLDCTTFLVMNVWRLGVILKRLCGFHLSQCTQLVRWPIFSSIIKMLIWVYCSGRKLALNYFVMCVIYNTAGFVFHRTATAHTSCLMSSNKSQACKHAHCGFKTYSRVQMFVMIGHIKYLVLPSWNPYS